MYIALKWFLDPQILESYGVDPGRIGISGDSAGGNLAAAVAQQVRCSAFSLIVFSYLSFTNF